jgi:hypothetical protein
MGISCSASPDLHLLHERRKFFSFVKHFTVYGECMHSARKVSSRVPLSFASMLLFLTRRGVEQDDFGSYRKSH